MLDTEGHKYTHTGIVILIAFLLQQWLQERASMLRYTYIACFGLHRSYFVICEDIDVFLVFSTDL